MAASRDAAGSGSGSGRLLRRGAPGPHEVEEEDRGDAVRGVLFRPPPRDGSIRGGVSDAAVDAWLPPSDAVRRPGHLRKSSSFSDFHTIAPPARDRTAEGSSDAGAQLPQGRTRPRNASLTCHNQILQQQQRWRQQAYPHLQGLAGASQAAAPAVDAVERDAYGFEKKSAHVSEEMWRDFEKRYAPIVAARKAKWDALLQESGGLWPLPSPKALRKERRTCSFAREVLAPLQRGGPPHATESGPLSRADVPGGLQDENHGADIRADRKSYPEVEKRLGPRAEKFADLHRTFPENIKFRSSSVASGGAGSPDTSGVAAIQSLRRVLRALALHVPAVGYCQSLNFICGMMLLFVPEEEAFWLLAHLIQNMLPSGTYGVTMEGANVDQEVLMALISTRLPDIANKLVDPDFPADAYASAGRAGSASTRMSTFRRIQRVPALAARARSKTSGGVGGGPNADAMPISLVTSNWFLTLYINILPVETVLRVWDVLFYEGNKILFRVALSLFKIHEDAILALKNPLDVFQFVQNMPKKMLDCDSLVEHCFTGVVGDLSRTGLESLREVARRRRRDGMET